MKSLILAGLAGAAIGMAGLAASASADVTRLTAHFAGGCSKDNNGNCKIKATATGTDLTSESVRLYTAPSSTGTFVLVSKRLHTLDADGRAEFRVKNNAGACYEVRTGPNGNDKPDKRSRPICE